MMYSYTVEVVSNEIVDIYKGIQMGDTFIMIFDIVHWQNK